MNTRPRFFVARFLAPLLVVAAVCGQAVALNSANASPVGTQDEGPTGGSGSLITDELQKQLEDDTAVSDAEIAAGSEIVASLGIADWLGPLAPMALSPFFGVTCMSGMALFGGDWLPMQSGLLSPNSPLANPAVFWTFLVLTVLTSLPRLTKVSKPFAQAVDHVEAYAGIATILTLKIVLSLAAPAPEEVDVVYHQAGFLTLTADMLLMLAMAINMIVLYAYSPIAAMVVNLLMLGACLLVFNWVHRRVVFCRTMALDPILSAIFRARATPTEPKLVVFPQGAFGPFPTRAKLILEPHDTGWRLTMRRWFRPAATLDIAFDGCDPMMHTGIVANTLDLNADGTKPLSFSKRYSNLPALAKQLRCGTQEDAAQAAGGASPGFA